MEPVIPHLHLEASPGAEEAAPEPALTGASGHPAEPPAGSPDPAQARTTHAAPGPGQAWIAASAQAAWRGRHRRRANGFQLITDLDDHHREDAGVSASDKTASRQPAGRASDRGQGRQA
jgi:hypothetical protein